MSESEMAEPWLEASDSPEEPEGWALRPVLLALLGLVTGFGVHLNIGADTSHTPSVMHLTELTALVVGAGLFGLTVERRHVPAALVFALVCAGVAAGIVWWNGNPDNWGGGDGWRMFSLVMALAIAAPLFQSARDAEGFGFGYESVHDHAWTNIVLWVACWVFVGITYGLAWLLASLFQLIEIDFLRELLMKDWFNRCLIGLAFGAALGILREHDFVVRLLQRVVATVLAVLAPVLAIGLVMFLLALPFTGLAPLWKAGSATAILLACATGALILANAVIGNAPEQARRFPVLRFGAMALGLVILPLAFIAAVAIGLRIDQYGFTPERLWALTFVVIASVFGVAYIVALVRGRLDWAEKVRPSNLVLGFVLCGVALLLSTPLVSFNAISTKDQVARLESGKLTPEKFDWRALAFGFGEAGKKELKRLTTSSNAAIRARAVEVSKAESQWGVAEIDRRDEQNAALIKNTRVLPAGTAIPAELLTLLRNDSRCSYERSTEKCTLAFLTGGKEAVLLSEGCFPVPKPAPTAGPDGVVKLEVPVALCNASSRFALVNGKWEAAGRDPTPPDAAAAAAGYREGKIEIRPVTRRQVFVGGVPVDDAFE